MLAELTKLRADTQKELEALQKARTLIPPSDKHALDNNEQQQNEVYNELAMPEFSATLLGLLGISAGTYVGFKLPETRAQ